MRFNRIRRAANLIIIALLLFLFFVPEMYLSRTADALIEKLDAAEIAAKRGEIESARLRLAELQAVTERSVPPLKLFMNHEGVDALILSVAAAAPMHEQEDILSAAAGIRAGVEQLRQIECFSWRAML